MKDVRQLKIGFLIFEDLEELDLAGPWEVFGTAGEIRPGSTALFAIGAGMEPLRGNKGLRIIPDLTFADAPDLDILIVPGGRGRIEAMKDPDVITFLRTRAPITGTVAAVCTGAFILAEAGLLDDREATTHWAFLDELRAYPAIKVRDDLRYVDAGVVLTSGGVACGVDMSLHLVRKLCGGEVAEEVAKRICYVAPPVSRSV